MNTDIGMFARDHRAAGDYTGTDGRLYCGVCHAPKQKMINGKLLPITCQCREAEFSKKQEEEREKRIAKLREKCFPAEAMRGHTFAAAGDEKHTRKARRYVDNWDTVCRECVGLMLFGNTGTGKTYTAQCIANALIDREIPVLYISAVELVAALTDREKRPQIMERVLHVPLLIIDDIGAERGTEFSREQICAAIDARSEAEKPLIVTTNITPDEMKNCKEQSLSRIYDRLDACCVPVAVTGESKRGKVAAGKLRIAREILNG